MKRLARRATFDGVYHACLWLKNAEPLRFVGTYVGYKPRERVLSPEELRKVWNACEEDTFGRIVRLLILTGQRAGEVKKLSRPMIEPGAITLPSWLTKNGREHSFPVGAMTALLLKHLPFESLPNFARAKDKLDERAGVRGWTLHDLRRTLRTRWAELGIPRYRTRRRMIQFSRSTSWHTRSRTATQANGRAGDA